MTFKLKTKTFLLCGGIAGPVFMSIVLIEGLLRTGYNSFLYPLSSLAIGDSGWTQMLNFIFTGISIVAFSSGLKRVIISNNVNSRGPLLVKLAGYGLIGAGIFVTDPIFGYPTNEPLVIRQYTFHGHLHDGFSMLFFICLPWACFVFRHYFIGKSIPGMAKYSMVSGSAMIVAFIITSMGFKQLPGFVNYAGIFQRLCVSIGLIWIMVLALHFLISQSETETNKINAFD